MSETLTKATRQTKQPTLLSEQLMSSEGGLSEWAELGLGEGAWVADSHNSRRFALYAPLGVL